MRSTPILVAVVLLGTVRAAFGGGCVPAAPALSTVAILPPAGGCQYVFNPDGSLAGISADVELLDAGGAPIPGATIIATLTGVAGTMKKCPTGDATAITDAAGMATVTFGAACGCGAFTLGIASICADDITTIRALGVFGPFPGTSPDLNGSCDIQAAPVNVIDLGIWAGCLAVPGICCDYTCDGFVTVVDLGVWASGLLTSCP